MNFRAFALPIVAVAALSACSKNPKTKQGEFWLWFQNHRAEFSELFNYTTQAAGRNDSKIQKKTETTVEEIGVKLREIHPEFSPFLGFADGLNEMTVTVNGQSKYFEAVDLFVSSAPAIDGWKFIALKQPLKLSADTEIQSGTAKLRVGDFRYTKSTNGNGSFDFVIQIPAKVSEDPDGFKRLLTQITMDLLGERLASTAVGIVTVVQLTDPTSSESLPLINIQADVSQAMKK